MTLGGFACSRPPRDRDWSQGNALFARGTLKTPGLPLLPTATSGSSPEAIRFPSHLAEVETDPCPRVKESERKTPLMAPYVREINIYGAERFVLPLVVAGIQQVLGAESDGEQPVLGALQVHQPPLLPRGPILHCGNDCLQNLRGARQG